MARYTQKPQDISRLLSDSPLAAQQQQVAVLHKLNKVLAEVLQLEQLSFCQVSSIRHGWLTRLKLQRDAILDNFRRKILPDLAGIDIEASPNGQILKPTPTLKPQAVIQKSLSEQQAALLKQTAENTSAEVREALLKLAQRINTDSKK